MKSFSKPFFKLRIVNRIITRKVSNEPPVSAYVALALQVNEDIVTSFPDLVPLVDYKVEGKYKESIIVLDRVYDILKNATGVHSDRSNQILRALIKTHYYAQNYDKIELILSTNESFKRTTEYTFDNLLILSLSRIRTFQFSKSLTAINDAIEISEDRCLADDKQCSSISIKGYIQILQNNYYEGQSLLRKSGKASNNQLLTFGALTNMVLQHLLSIEPLTNYLKGHLIPTYHFQFYERDFIKLPITRYTRTYIDGNTENTTNTNIRYMNNTLAEQDILRIKESISGIHQAVTFIDQMRAPQDYESLFHKNPSPDMNTRMASENKEDFVNAFTKVKETASQKFKNNSNDSTISSTEATDMTPTTTTSATTTATNIVHDIKMMKESKGKDDLHDTHLREVATNPLFITDFAIAYVTNICLLAELYNHIGQFQDANEYLSNALKVLEVQKEVFPKVIAPIYAKVLGLLAYQYMYNMEVVNAEGLFNSALSEYKKYISSIGGIHRMDLRYVYDYAIVKGRYGLLLKHWENRESNGDKLVQEANSLISKLTPLFHVDIRVPKSSSTRTSTLSKDAISSSSSDSSNDGSKESTVVVAESQQKNETEIISVPVYMSGSFQDPIYGIY